MTFGYKGEKEMNIVKELLFWSYANLAMAHTALDKKQNKYATFNYMIRAKLFKGLMEGSMNIRTIFDDEKIKLLSGNMCSYCGVTENLAVKTQGIIWFARAGLAIVQREKKT